MEEVNFAPMMCQALTLDKFKKQAWNGYLPELKIDGWRAIAIKNGKSVHVYSRTGIERTGHVPHIVEQFKKLPDGVYDGEVVFVYYGSPKYVTNQPVPRMSFNNTARIMGSGENVALHKQNALANTGALTFIIFDVMELNGEDLRSVEFMYRKAHLVEDLDYTQHIRPVINWSRKVDLVTLYYSVIENNLEGLVLKNQAGLYVNGKRPVNNQYKLKTEKFFDVVVTGYTMAKPGKFEGLVGALKFSVYDPKTDEFVEVGQTSGMDDYLRVWFTQQLAGPTGSESDHKIVIEIKCNDLTDAPNAGYGIPRHPQFVRIREDKSPRECYISQLAV